MTALKLKIVTPEKVVYENEVVKISLPTPDGEITVLPHHIPLITILAAGELRLTDMSGAEHIMAVAGGFVEVRGGTEIIILADNADRVEEIDVTEAEAARARAEEQMRKIANKEDVDYARLQAVIEREMNKLRVGRKYKDVKKGRQVGE
ncbi:MAG TPA: ATP synthase F1 subunit epsilon [Candidatus Magasanikbacteria bacterium]|nr:ATP synthase F1 subunit epsilon [Candidatus Magasanikbacteria bacterium]